MPINSQLFTRLLGAAIVVMTSALAASARADEADKRFPLFAYLTGKPTPALITYTPSQLDPRQEANQRRLTTSSIRADLEALRPAFDGLVLYGYNEVSTPRILAVARELKFRAVLLAIWDPKSAAEVDGVVELARQFGDDFALGVLVGNEGITFNRYEPDDVKFAGAQLRSKLPKTVPLGTSEPLAAYASAFVASSATSWRRTSTRSSTAPTSPPRRRPPGLGRKRVSSRRRRRSRCSSRKPDSRTPESPIRRTPRRRSGPPTSSRAC